MCIKRNLVVEAGGEGDETDETDEGGGNKRAGSRGKNFLKDSLPFPLYLAANSSCFPSTQSPIPEISLKTWTYISYLKLEHQ